jgi:hypothetical protein
LVVVVVVVLGPWTFCFLIGLSAVP